MDYVISYTFPCGRSSLMVYSYEVASILRNLALMAIENKISLSNVTLRRL